ncbi:MAG TPA: hypothetical protein VK524_08065, partial [Polyangiaceae bacterium]|nr:hypothetical protein [Polyangiaceae bacterium]
LRMLDRTLDMVAKVQPDQLVARIRQAFAQLDAARCTWLVRRYAVRLGEGWDECLEPLRARHPSLAEQLLICTRDMQARALVRRAREITNDEEVRFLLAAMLVATSQSDVYALVARRFSLADGKAQTHALLERAPPMVLYPWDHMLTPSAEGST